MTDDEIATAAERFHEDVSHQFQVSLTMSMETRERLRAIQDELNDCLEEQTVNTNDVMRIALLSAARYHALATGDLGDLEAIDEERLVPLTAPVRDVLDEEGVFDG
ncbi:hypothetical protein [Natrinema sp. SYSU A 869]|uniref:hypothetical protein n=1 Tax=Natrinema sp. SYSU A 869 TaxID=2871694 RepID=UPI001CA3D5EE|nr:hypothetical protein [Natrinema sp. SYSU A 869]